MPIEKKEKNPKDDVALINELEYLNSVAEIMGNSMVCIVGYSFKHRTIDSELIKLFDQRVRTWSFKTKGEMKEMKVKNELEKLAICGKYSPSTDQVITCCCLTAGALIAANAHDTLQASGDIPCCLRSRFLE